MSTTDYEWSATCLQCGYIHYVHAYDSRRPRDLKTSCDNCSRGLFEWSYKRVTDY